MSNTLHRRSFLGLLPQPLSSLALQQFCQQNSLGRRRPVSRLER